MRKSIGAVALFAVILSAAVSVAWNDETVEVVNPPPFVGQYSYNTMIPPATGKKYEDPVFGTHGAELITRVTDFAAVPHDPTVSVTNADEGYALFETVSAIYMGTLFQPFTDGGPNVPANPTAISPSNFALTPSSQPRWSKLNPRRLYFHDEPGNNNYKIYRWDTTDANAVELTFDLTCGGTINAGTITGVTFGGIQNIESRYNRTQPWGEADVALVDGGDREDIVLFASTLAGSMVPTYVYLLRLPHDGNGAPLLDACATVSNNPSHLMSARTLGGQGAIFIWDHTGAGLNQGVEYWKKNGAQLVYQRQLTSDIEVGDVGQDLDTNHWQYYSAGFVPMGNPNDKRLIRYDVDAATRNPGVLSFIAPAGDEVNVSARGQNAGPLISTMATRTDPNNAQNWTADFINELYVYRYSDEHYLGMLHHRSRMPQNVQGLNCPSNDFRCLLASPSASRSDGSLFYRSNFNFQPPNNSPAFSSAFRYEFIDMTGVQTLSGYWIPSEANFPSDSTYHFSYSDTSLQQCIMAHPTQDGRRACVLGLVGGANTDALNVATLVWGSTGATGPVVDLAGPFEEESFLARVFHTRDPFVTSFAPSPNFPVPSIYIVPGGGMPALAADLAASPATSGCGLPATVTFSGSGSHSPRAGGSIVSYLWDFGDGQMGSGVQVSHTYQTAGTFYVSLTVRDEAGISEATYTSTVAGCNPPTASVARGKVDGTAPQKFLFDCSPSLPGANGATITSYSWTFSDGALASGAYAVHEFTTSGPKWAQCSVTNSVGESSTVTVNVRLDAPAMNVSFTPLRGVAPLNVAVDCRGAAATAPGAHIASYSIDFGDGSAPVLANQASHNYTTRGSFVASCTAVDSNGTKGQAARVVHVNGPTGTAAGNPLVGAGPLTVTFNCAGITSAFGSVAGRHWKFGDGAEGDGTSIQHVYTSPGTYLATCYAVDDVGVSNQASVSVTVN